MLTRRLRQLRGGEGGLAVVRVKVEAQLLNHLLDYRERQSPEKQGLDQFLQVTCRLTAA